MAKPKSAKIYIRVEDRLYDFMWANVMADESVVMGLRFEGQQQIELVAEHDGQRRPPQIEAPRIVCHPKISFHRSGHYKLDAKVGLTPSLVDRSTVIGPRLEDIDEPRRMLEVLLPEVLPVASKDITDRDIILDASTAPRQPLACTISCMSEREFHRVMDANAKFVDTSSWEFVHALKSERHVWVWALRTSPGHTNYPNRFIIGLLGEVKWGKESESGT